MKKTILLSSLMIAILSFSTAFTSLVKTQKKHTGIEFYEGTWGSALAQARKDNKLVFLDANATWCPPCKALKKRTFTDSAVGKFYNEHFINVDMNMEVGEGKTVAAKYAVNAYPTLIFVNGKGEIVKKTTGFMHPAEFLALGKAVIKNK